MQTDAFCRARYGLWMMKNSTVLRILIPVALLACTAGCQTAAQRRFEASQADATISIEAGKACVTAARAKAEYASVVQRNPEDRPSLAQQSDTSFISDVDRAAYLALNAEVEGCRTVVYNAAARRSAAMYDALISGHNEADKIRLALVQRKLTWGQFVLAMQDQQSKQRSNVQAADQAYRSGLQEDHDREIAARQQAAAAFATVQQQMEESRQRQQMINAINRPVNTTCNRFGDQVNCHTY